MKNFIPKIKSKINQNIYLEGSKSIANRALVISAMSNGKTMFENFPNNDDVFACVNALKHIGCTIEYNQYSQTLTIYGLNGEFKNKNIKIFCHESGTLTRFIIPICAVQGFGYYYIYAKQRMMERPLFDLLKPLEKLGMKCLYHEKSHSMPLTINANYLEGGSIYVDGKKSSQFASGLLIASPFMRLGLTLNSITDHNQPYLNMTAKVMSDFGIDVDIEKDIYKVNRSNYKSPGKYIIEPDLSTASYFFAFAAITGSTIKVMNLTKESKQGDIKFLDVLEMIGCRVKYLDDGISVTGPNKLKGININMRNFSDTFMTLATISCFADSDTCISGLNHTQGQESYRIFAMASGLKKFGMYVDTTEDSILISPSRSTFHPAEVDSFNDHRIAMSLALLGLRNEGVIINNSEVVSKTCPKYFDIMLNLVG